MLEKINIGNLKTLENNINIFPYVNEHVKIYLQCQKDPLYHPLCVYACAYFHSQELSTMFVKKRKKFMFSSVHISQVSFSRSHKIYRKHFSSLFWKGRHQLSMSGALRHTTTKMIVMIVFLTASTET